MTTKPPVALFCFSKDLDNFLDVDRERTIIEDTLKEYHANHRLTVIARTGVSIEDIFNLFNDYRERIILFHFAGHAGGKGLQFNVTTTKTEYGATIGLTDLFKREVQHGQLQFVFLNGCNTALQFDQLKAAGVPNVIGTNYPVSDNNAIAFSHQFYKSLANREFTVTIKQAFDDGIAYLKTKSRTPESIERGFVFESEDNSETQSRWELEPVNADWALPTKVIIPLVQTIKVSEYVLPKHKYNWLFRWLPFLDFKQQYWQILDNNSFFTKANLKQLFKLYITPSQYRFESDERQQLLQDFGNEKDKVSEKIGNQNILNLLKYGFLANDGKRPVLILADTGMGKTTLLQKLFVDYARTYPKYQLAFIYSGENTIAQINAIENKANTVLFLDALDEDVEARKNLHQHIDDLTEAVTNFRKVFVTCRNQFFKSNSEEWQHLKGKTDVYRVELLAFTTDEAKAYIDKHPMQLKTKQIARQIFNKNQSFFTRPLLLSYLEFLANNTQSAKTYEFLYQVYEEIINKWGKREAKTTQQGKTYNRTYSKDLIAFSKKVAQELYENTDFDLVKLAKEKDLKVIDAQSRSLLTRNRITDIFEFTHRSFQEYFWAELFFDQTFREENAIDGSPHPLLTDIKKYPYTLQFYNEMVWSRIVGVKKTEEVTIDGQVVDLGSNQLKQLSISNDVNALFTLPNRQIRAFAIKYKDDLFVEYNDNQGIRLTNKKTSHFVNILIKESIEFGFQLMQTLSKKDIRNHYFKIYFRQYNEAIKANTPPLVTNFFLDQFFEEIFNYFAKTLKLKNIKVSNIWELQNLNSLKLKKNQLTSLPKEIELLQNLNSLDLVGNSTLDLIDTFEKLKPLQNLNSLNLFSNQLTSLPKEIGLLQNLNSLNLWNNQLTSLPKEIGLLQNLNSLDLRNNQLTSLPKEIELLQNLNSLNLGYNQLTSLPKEIGLLQNLNSLNLRENPTLDLIDTFEKLKPLQNLNSLNLFSNQLTSLPKEIGLLQNLNSLGLEYNRLTNFPKEIVLLQNLNSLDLSNNQLTSLPKEIELLQNLNSLGLEYNRLTSLPKEIGLLQNLNSLNLGYNQLTSLPKEIGLLQNLNSLDLRNNQLTSLPKEIGLLQNFNLLVLWNNQFPETEKQKIKNLLPNCEIYF